MNASNWIQLLGLAITLLLFMLPIVYFAGKLVAKLETIGARLGGLETKIENFSRDCFTKSAAAERISESDKQRLSMWAQIDALKKSVARALFKLGINPVLPDEESKT